MEREREMWRGRGGDRGKAGTWEIFFSTSRPREPQREKTYLFFLLSFSKPRRRKGNIPAVRNFANILLNASTTGDLAAIAPAVGGALDTLCSRERFTPSQLVGGGCKSPEVELRMVPAECLMTPTTGEVVCRPAYLLLEQRPAECFLP